MISLWKKHKMCISPLRAEEFQEEFNNFLQSTWNSPNTIAVAMAHIWSNLPTSVVTLLVVAYINKTNEPQHRGLSFLEDHREFLIYVRVCYKQHIH